LIMVGFNSIPTIKSSKAIPKFPNDWNAVFACNNPGTKRLIAVPAIIYQMIIGCFNAFIIPTLKSTIQITILNEVKNCSAIFFDREINTIIIPKFVIFVKYSKYQIWLL
jgi:hypothetical protein